MSAEAQNALTIDVEDYWSIFSRDWLHKDMEPSDAVVNNTEWLLQTLAQHGVKATFFILGDVAKKFPFLIKRISKTGHEIGAHGFSHKQIFKLSKEQFRHEVGDCKKLLEDITSAPVNGHRAPAFSIKTETKWALEVLAQEGFKYDSSVYPISGKRYGWPGLKKEIHTMQLPNGQNIIEVPMSTISLGIKELGVGGGYMRHFPYIYTKCAIKHMQKKQPAIVYMHPYEIDTVNIDFSLNHLSGEERKKVERFHRIQMRNRKTVKPKLSKLLSDFKFTTIKDLIEIDNY